VTNLFAAMADPQVFLVHDINFHRAVAAASGNPIVASLVEMVSALYYERRRDTAARASDRAMRDAAEMHRRIYQAIRAHDADEARRAMQTHLMQASAHQARESDASEPSSRGNGSAARSRRVKH
jgi:GntR family transcriptional regulator, transcriptional repressor for pyruvate dehydrogenase complex